MLRSFPYSINFQYGVIYFITSGLSFCPRLVLELPSFTGRLWFSGSSNSSCKFPRLFRFAVFVHSSCSVVVSYFMFIPVIVIFFQLLCSIFVLTGYGKTWMRVISACDNITFYCQKTIKPRPQNWILVSLRAPFQNFRLAAMLFLYHNKAIYASVRYDCLFFFNEKEMDCS